MSDSKSPALTPVQRLPAFLLGGGLVLLGLLVLVRVAPPARSFTQLLALSALGSGCLWMLLACFQRGTHRWSLFRLINNNALVLVGLVALAEITGRTLKIDFNQFGGKSAAELREAYPICAREPDQPLAEVYFRHPGPINWQGQPLRALELLRKGTDNAYLNEPSITVSYDRDGFRNPADLKDWDVTIVGDSYTEQGYLPIQQISSSIIAQRSGLRVKNLGVCDTGLLTHARYLENYGHAASTHSVVFVMFEGNDVQDTTLEYEALQRFEKTGERDFRDTGPQTSFVTALNKAVSAFRNRPKEQSYQNAWFTPPGAKPLPISVSVELPIDPLRAAPLQLQALREALRSLCEEARQLQLAPLLAYVPVNNRVYHGMLKFGDSLPEEITRWQPNTLPEFIANACRENGLSFVDTTPALVEAARKGTFVHNRILDCHVNADGARIIGEVIAEALKSTVKPAQLAVQSAPPHGAP